MSDDKMVLVSHDTNLQPATLGELSTLAKHAAESAFFGAKTQSQALLLMMAGKDLGLSYTQSLRAFHVIEGRPALSADGMVAVCLGRRDVCQYFRTVESDDRHAMVETHRVGDPAPRRTAFTFEEAQRAGLVKEKGNWAKYPGRMCLARARSFLARDVYPDLLMGLYDPDELEAAPREVKPPMFRVVDSTRPSMSLDQFSESLRKAAPIAHDAETGEVFEAPAPAQDGGTFAGRIQAADTMGELEHISADITRAIESCTLETPAVEALKTLWRDRRDAIRGAKADKGAA